MIYQCIKKVRKFKAHRYLILHLSVKDFAKLRKRKHKIELICFLILMPHRNAKTMTNKYINNRATNRNIIPKTDDIDDIKDSCLK